MNTKKQLEKYLTRKISDSTYFRIKRVMSENNLPLTTANLEVVATIKNECTKHRTPFELGLSYYLKIANIEVKINGVELYQYLQKITNHKPYRTTIVRWFDGSFNPDKTYQTSELSKVLLHAFLYNLRNKNNVTQQKSTRKCEIPSEKIRNYSNK